MGSVALDQGWFVCPAFVFCSSAVTLKRAWVRNMIGGGILGTALLKSTVAHDCINTSPSVCHSHDTVFIYTERPSHDVRRDEMFFCCCWCFVFVSSYCFRHVTRGFPPQLRVQWKLSQTAPLVISAIASCSATSPEITDKTKLLTKICHLGNCRFSNTHTLL